jgi:hypothetical protein
MDPAGAFVVAPSYLNGHNGAVAAYHHNGNGNGYTSPPIHSPELNGNIKGRDSPGLPLRANGTRTPTSASLEIDPENRSATPREERLIVGVDFGTTYSGYYCIASSA